MSSTAGLYGRIMTLYENGNFKLASQSARPALKDAPDDAQLRELLGIAHHALRDFPRAMNAMETATLIAPLSPAAQVALAGCYLVSNRHDIARSIYGHLASQHSRVSIPLLAMVAAGLSRLNERHLALEVHRERAHRKSENDDTVFAVAHFMRLVEYPVELILPIAHRAFQLAPDRIRNRVALALLHHQCGNRSITYRLVTAVALGQLIAECCPCRLRGLVGLFDAMGDTGRSNACQLRLSKKRREAKG